MVRCSLISQCRNRYQKSIFRDVFQYAAGADGNNLCYTPLQLNILKLGRQQHFPQEPDIDIFSPDYKDIHK